MRPVNVILLLFYSLAATAGTFYVSVSDTSHEGSDIRAADIQRIVMSTKIKADSILFKRSERFFISTELRKEAQNRIYFGAYGDLNLPKPVLDGSIYHFDFDAEKWKDFEVIKGVKFYKRTIAGLESVENVYADKNILTMSREPDADETVITGMKNDFTGFFIIDSVDVSLPNKKFFDRKNKTDWTGAEVVTKTQQWSYEIRKIRNDGQLFEAEEKTSDSFKKGWGYFIQRHYSALDREGEWFYDEAKGILYFSPLKEKCTIYISSNREDNNSGFDMKFKKNISIENLSFTNYKHGIKLEGNQDITVKNCDFKNCTYGLINKTTYLERVIVEDNTFRNMHSYGIRLIANNSVINRNLIDSIGLSMSSESKGYDNLNGIESYGKNNIISDNVIKNVGYCAIRIYNCADTKVLKNKIENTNLMVADGGAIYSFHSMDGNKLIRGNTVKNAVGNVNGTNGDKNHACGIYLDELSLHFRIDSNYVANCGDGIYIQNSRSDTVMFNHTEKNRKAELHINHAGSILNGGRLNMSNDPDFDPDTLSYLPVGYLWEKEEGLLYYKNKKNGVVYVEPGNNLIMGNEFIPSDERYTFTFRTWQHIGNDIVINLTGNKDFFRNNVPDSLLKNTSFEIIGGNVKDLYQNGKDFNGLQNSFDKTMYDYLRKVHIYIGRGRKYSIER
jgi:hypothetical protein